MIPTNENGPKALSDFIKQRGKSATEVTWDDWRLASMDVNGDNNIVYCSLSTELACRDNELGYMFYQNGVSDFSPGPFTNVQFKNTLNSSDAFGFDDFTIGRVDQVIDPDPSVPEPGSLAIFAVIGLAADLRCRKRNKTA